MKDYSVHVRCGEWKHDTMVQGINNAKKHAREMLEIYFGMVGVTIPGYWYVTLNGHQIAGVHARTKTYRKKV